jgi:hypothetical protein
MDSVVYVDQNAIFGVSFAMRRHDNRGFIKFEELSFSTRREASLQRLDTPLDDNPRVSKKPIKGKVRIGGNSLCESRSFGDVRVQHGIVDS